MPQVSKIQYFGTEGRDNLPAVLKSIRTYYKQVRNGAWSGPSKVIFFTRYGEGPMLAYNELSGLDVSIIAVTFPATFSIKLSDGTLHKPEIPEKVRKFFNGVEIPIVTHRLPFDEINGSESHNRDMQLIQQTLGVLGGSISLAVQAVLQATDAGLVNIGEEVISATSDTAVVITASSSQLFLTKDSGMIINEILCKPRNLTITRNLPKYQETSIDLPEPEIQLPVKGKLA